MEILKQIAELKEELDGLRPINPVQEAAIWQKFRLDWNYHSNNLEGNSLTYGETKALLLFNITAQGKPLQDHLEIRGHNDALKWIEDLVKKGRPLTQAFIRDLHKLLLKENYEVDAFTSEGRPTKKKVIVGDYKKTQNYVKTSTGETLYFASPEETPAKMTDLLDWYEEKRKGSHSLLLAAEFHYRFIRIHPFDDGNGRLARILMNFILMQEGYPPVVIKTEEKQSYFSVLQQADAGLIQPFIQYVGENLLHSLQIMIKGAKGETVQEPDDVDKEIALIEHRLKVMGTKQHESITNRDKRLKVFEESLKTLLEGFIERAKKFAGFYEGIEEDLIINGRPVKLSLGKLFARMKEVDIVGIIGTKYQFRSFNRSSVPSFFYFSSLLVNFDEKDYVVEIKSTNLQESIHKEYTSKWSMEEIDTILNKISSAHSKYINEQINETQ